jgi:hypothetical protein
VCPALDALFSKGLSSWAIVGTSLQVFAKALVSISSLADEADEADEAAEAAEADEADDSGSASSTPRSRAL